MKAQTYLHIPKPCHEDWDKMNPTQQGRHCESCCKTVVDFEMMTDQQVLNFFAHAKGETCGRFSDDQLNRALEETQLQKKKGWQWFVATIASMLFFANRSSAQDRSTKGEVKQRAATNQSLIEEQKKAQEKLLQQRRVMGKLMARPVVKTPQQTADTNCTKTIIKTDTVLALPKTLRLSGLVTDEKDRPLSNVTVMARAKGDHEKPIQMLATNAVGEFTMPNALKYGENVEIKFSAIGFEDKTVPLVFDESKLELHVQLKEKVNQLEDVVVVSSGRTHRVGQLYQYYIKPPKVDTLSSIKKALGIETFKVYPNPASRGKAVNLNINETGDYSVQLLDNNARLINVQNISVSAKKEIKLFNIPAAIQRGVYYIRLVNEKNKKQYTDKIIVQ
jgi:hypothetical protein